MKIKRDDTVKIISGKDRGKTGKVIRVLPKERKIIVERVNVKKKHSKSKKRGQKGQIIQMAMPINASNAMVICASCNKTVRLGSKTIGTKKVRICKKCSAELR